VIKAKQEIAEEYSTEVMAKNSQQSIGIVCKLIKIRLNSEADVNDLYCTSSISNYGNQEPEN